VRDFFETSGLITPFELAAGSSGPPEQVMLFVSEVRGRLTLVSLDESEYWEAIKTSAERGFTSGRVYDALLLACAVKVRAQIIYTWNLGHFRAIAPELGNRIRTP